jgi:hypothetical protein
LKRWELMAHGWAMRLHSSVSAQVAVSLDRCPPSVGPAQPQLLRRRPPGCRCYPYAEGIFEFYDAFRWRERLARTYDCPSSMPIKRPFQISNALLRLILSSKSLLDLISCEIYTGILMGMALAKTKHERDARASVGG